MFIPDPISGSWWIPDPGVKKAPDSGPWFTNWLIRISLRIQSFYPGSEFSISDPGSKIFRISDPPLHRRIYVFLTQKLFLSSRNYDPDLDFYPSRIPDPGVIKAPDPGSWSINWLIRIYNGCQDEVQVNYLWVHIILAFLLIFYPFRTQGSKRLRIETNQNI